MFFLLASIPPFLQCRVIKEHHLLCYNYTAYKQGMEAVWLRDQDSPLSMNIKKHKAAIKLSHIKYYLAQQFQQYAFDYQEDAEEFLFHLISSLHDEMIVSDHPLVMQRGVDSRYVSFMHGWSSTSRRLRTKIYGSTRGGGGAIYKLGGGGGGGGAIYKLGGGGQPLQCWSYQRYFKCIRSHP